MSKVKISKFSLISVVFLSLQLGACAKEVPVSDTQSSNEQIKKTVTQEVKKEIDSDSLIKPKLAVVERVASTPATPVEQIQSQSQTSKPIIGEPIVQTKAETVIEEKTAAQEMLNLDQYKGKVVYLDFWASWCVPCQQTFPWMDAMQKKYPDDIVFVAVNFGENPEDTQEFLKRFPADIKYVYDPLMQISREYGIPGLPYSFVYGRNGDLLGKHAGFAGGSAENLEAALNNLFASGQ